MIRVLVVDDQAMILEGLSLLISHAPDLDVVATARNGAQAIDLAQQLHPDVICMDIQMPVTDGITATREITQTTPDTKVLMLTTFGDQDNVHEALVAGASGFVLKDTPSQRLLDAIRVIHDGQALLDPAVTRDVIAAYTTRPDITARRNLDNLTPRETQVLTLIAQGLNNTEISERLVISSPTVKTHVRALLTKLDARDRAQLVIVAYQSGLVS